MSGTHSVVRSPGRRRQTTQQTWVFAGPRVLSVGRDPGESRAAGSVWPPETPGVAMFAREPPALRNRAALAPPATQEKFVRELEYKKRMHLKHLVSILIFTVHYWDNGQGKGYL